jgi:hypothetical protein
MGATTGVHMSIEESKQDAVIGKLPSLADTHRGTHIDLMRLPLDMTGTDNKPWHFSRTCVDRAAAQRVLTEVLAQLHAASRRIVQIQPVTAGFGQWLATEGRQTSNLGVYKSEELGFGYSYTDAVLVISEDL